MRFSSHSGSSLRSRPARDSTARLIRRRALALVSAGVNPIAMDLISNGRADARSTLIRPPTAPFPAGSAAPRRQARKGCGTASPRARSGPGKADVKGRVWADRAETGGAATVLIHQAVHDGRVWADRAETGGAAFHIRLPRA